MPCSVAGQAQATKVIGVVRAAAGLGLDMIYLIARATADTAFPMISFKNELPQERPGTRV